MKLGLWSIGRLPPPILSLIKRPASPANEMFHPISSHFSICKGSINSTCLIRRSFWHAKSLEQYSQLRWCYIMSYHSHFMPGCNYTSCSWHPNHSRRMSEGTKCLPPSKFQRVTLSNRTTPFQRCWYLLSVHSPAKYPPLQQPHHRGPTVRHHLRTAGAISLGSIANQDSLRYKH